MLTGAMWLLEGRLEVFCYCGTVGWLRRGRFVWADMWRPVPLGMWMMAWIWAFAGAYGSNRDNVRRWLWDELAGLISIWDVSWCIGGDFNVTLSRLRSCALENVRQPRRTCALENVRQACGCALGERSPRPANVRTRGQQTRQARGQLVLATSRLQDETNGLD
jgi:hypothetical protein